MINVNIVNDVFNIINLESQGFIYQDNNYKLHKKYDESINILLKKYNMFSNVDKINDESLFNYCKDVSDLVILDHINNIILSKFLDIYSCYKLVMLIDLNYRKSSIDLLSLYDFKRIDKLKYIIKNDYTIKTYHDILTFTINKLIPNIYMNLIYNVYLVLIISTPKYYLSFKEKYISYGNVLKLFNHLDEDNIEDSFEELKYFYKDYKSDSYCIEVYPITNIIKWH